jgi:prepilin-type N-terminal cleavage/methylation domain-containing protein
MKIKNRSHLKKLLKGFTIVELLVVLSLVGILAGLLIVSLKSAQNSALDGRRKADLESIKLALEIYKSSCGTGAYPATGSVPFGSPLSCTVRGSSITIMTSVPQDPQFPTKSYTYTRINNSDYTTEAIFQTGQAYVVTPLGSHSYTPTATPTPPLAPTPTTAPTATPTPTPIYYYCHYKVTPNCKNNDDYVGKSGPYTDTNLCRTVFCKQNDVANCNNGSYYCDKNP